MGASDVPTAIRLCRLARGSRPHRLVRGTCAARELQCAEAGCATRSTRRSWGERGHTKRATSMPIPRETSSPDSHHAPTTSPGPVASPSSRRSRRSARPIYIPVSPHDAAGPINVVAGAQRDDDGAELSQARNVASGTSTSTTPSSRRRSTIRTAASSCRGSPGLGVEMNRDYLEARDRSGRQRPQDARSTDQ